MATIQVQNIPDKLSLTNKNDSSEDEEILTSILCELDTDTLVIDKFSAQLFVGDFNGINDHDHKTFLEIVHHECMGISQVTAEKLIYLQYPLWQVVLLGNPEIIEHMILLGCPVDSFHVDKKFTSLIRAVQFLDLEIVKILVKHHANVDLADCRGLLPIAHYGSQVSRTVQHPEIIKILLDKSSTLKNLRQGNIAYQFKRAFEYGNKEVVKMLIEHNNEILYIADWEGQTPLHYLSGNFHSDVIELLQGRNINVNIGDAAGRTPLFMATQYPYYHKNALNFLLKNGANVNAKTIVENTVAPLFSLCFNPSVSKESYFEIVELFLEHNLDIQIVGSNRNTVFDCIMKNKKFYMAEPLLAHLAILDALQTSISKCIRDKISSQQIFKSYFDVCKIELAKMKSHIINENLTLYKIVVNQISEEKIVESCRFSPSAIAQLKNFEQLFEPNNFYYNIVKKRISSVVLKLELIHEASLVLCKFFQLGSNPYHLVVYEILKFLDIQDLKCLTEVYT